MLSPTVRGVESDGGRSIWSVTEVLSLSGGRGTSAASSTKAENRLGKRGTMVVMGLPFFSWEAPPSSEEESSSARLRLFEPGVASMYSGASTNSSSCSGLADSLASSFALASPLGTLLSGSTLAVAESPLAMVVVCGELSSAVILAYVWGVVETTGL